MAAFKATSIFGGRIRKTSSNGLRIEMCDAKTILHYTEDIFILIFFQDALKNSFFPVKAMDKN